MERPGSSFSELLGTFKSWVLRCSERQESRDFWMPDDSCRVCYDCDAQFTLFNRKHHCRLYGRIFCSRCSTNSVPATALGHKRPAADRERIRVSSYCYKQWHQEVEAAAMAAALARLHNARCSTPGLSPSLSETSMASSRTSCTGKSCSTITLLYSNRGYSSFRPFAAENDEQDARRMDFDPDEGSPSLIPYACCLSRYCSSVNVVGNLALDVYTVG